MRIRFAYLAVAVSILLVAVAGWWFWPAGDSVRLISFETTMFGRKDEGLAVFDQPAQLQEASPDHWETLADAVDFDHEKLVRMRFVGTGYQTEQTVDGETKLSETQFGEPAVCARRGGRAVRFYVDRPTPYLLYGRICLVFEARDFEAWYAVPRSAEVSLLSDTTTRLDDTLFVSCLFTFVGVGVVVDRRRRRGKDHGAKQETAAKAEGAKSCAAG